MTTTTTNWTYNNANRISTMQIGSNPITNFTYDANGNMLSDGQLTYTWNRANRLVTTNNGAYNTHYTYTGDGDRVRQTVGGAITDYILDTQPELALVLQASTASETLSYMHTPMGLQAVENSAGDWHYHITDGLGSVRGQVDAFHDMTASQMYDPYGQAFDVTGTFVGDFGFAGEQIDPSGLSYNRARYYNPAMGTFTALDPFEGLEERPMSMNGYSYAENNPSNWTDPSGEFVPIALAGLGTIAAGFLAKAGIGISLATITRILIFANVIAIIGYVDGVLKCVTSEGCILNIALADFLGLTNTSRTVVTQPIPELQERGKAGDLKPIDISDSYGNNQPQNNEENDPRPDPDPLGPPVLPPIGPDGNDDCLNGQSRRQAARVYAQTARSLYNQMRDIVIDAGIRRAQDVDRYLRMTFAVSVVRNPAGDCQEIISINNALPDWLENPTVPNAPNYREEARNLINNRGAIPVVYNSGIPATFSSGHAETDLYNDAIRLGRIKAMGISNPSGPCRGSGNLNGPNCTSYFLDKDVYIGWFDRTGQFKP